MTKEERQQMLDNQKMIDEMAANKTPDTNTEVHSQITSAMGAFSEAEDEQKRKETLRKKLTGR